MKEDSKTLEEVVVVGYGVMKKKDLTGAVASLKASDLEKNNRKLFRICSARVWPDFR